MPRTVFVQCQVSQLDEPVYARMHAIDPDDCAVVYWNDYGFSRKHVDPEIGVVPDFIEEGTADYRKSWLDSRNNARAEVQAAVLALTPRVVVLSDLPQLDRLRLALALRRRDIKVALRVDKSHLSHRPRRGLELMAERLVVRQAFDILAPTSPLTSTYYAWPADRPCIPFPYTTNEQKFAPGADVRGARRREMRDRLGLATGSYVFLSAVKFVERESPWDLIRSFAKVAEFDPSVHLVALGDGPLLPEIKHYCFTQGLGRITLPGFVPFRELQDYFFAADTLLHLVAVGPWEISPQDALIAGLGLVASDKVGSAQVFLEGALHRFLVPLGKPDAAAERMRELASRNDTIDLFAEARARTRDYTVEACARRWVKVAA